MHGQHRLSLGLGLAAALLHGAALVAAADCADVSCTASPGAHIIVTRESDAPQDTSIINVVALGVRSACAGSDIAEVPYPATETDYVSSEQQGVGNLTAMVLDYQTCCPDSAIVLMGYSQGAQVTADFLCGTSETGFPTTEAYAANVTDSVAAVVLMGDPSFVKGLPWDVGTANNTSYFPRQDTDACDPVADQMVSYCDYNDLYCDQGSSLAVHAGYVSEYHTEAVDFVVSALGC